MGNKLLLICSVLFLFSLTSVMAISYTDTGVRDSSGNLNSPRTADVVVCRGISLVNDAYQLSQCDVVCKSTDSDCSNEWQTAFSSNRKIVSLPAGAVYPMVQANPSAINLNGMFNVYIDGNGAILNFTSNGAVRGGLWILGGNNIHITHLNLQSNRICNGETISGTCYGIKIVNSTNLYFDDISVKDFLGFQIFTISSGNGGLTDNINIYNSRFQGLGTNDVLGGGTDIYNSTQSNINLHDNFCNQTGIIGTYSICIDMVGLDNSHFYNNEVYGGIYFGSETKRTANSKIDGNKVHPINLTMHGYIGIINSSSYETDVLNNQVYDGALVLQTSNSLIGDNNVNAYFSVSLIGLTGDNVQISNNHLWNGNKGIYTTGINNKIESNWINNVSIGANPIFIVLDSYSNDSTVNNNNLYLPFGSTAQYGIYSAASSNNRNDISNNHIYNYGVFTNYVIQISSTTSVNNTGFSNIIQGFGTNGGNGVTGGVNYLDSFNWSTNALPICNMIAFGRMSYNNTGSYLCTATKWSLLI